MQYLTSCRPRSVPLQWLTAAGSRVSSQAASTGHGRGRHNTRAASPPCEGDGMQNWVRLAAQTTDESARRHAMADARSTHRVLRELRSRILRGDLLPGEQLKQEQLAAELDVSRVPVREALMVLANQGLLTHRPNQGFVIA